MKQSERIKEIYFNEGLSVPPRFDERFRSLIVLDNATDREIYLTMAKNDLLHGLIDYTITNKDLFHKYDLELFNIMKEKTK